MASNLEDLKDEGKRDRLVIKKAEKALKDSFAGRIIPIINSQLNKHYFLMLDAVNQCHQTSPSLDGLSQCIGAAESVYFRKQDIAQASLLTFQRECQDCLTTCQSDINQQLAKCYQDCLIRFKYLSEEL